MQQYKDASEFTPDTLEETFCLPYDHIQLWLRKIEEIKDCLEVALNEGNPDFQELAYNEIFAQTTRKMMEDREFREMEELFHAMNVIIERGDLTAEKLDVVLRGENTYTLSLCYARRFRGEGWIILDVF